MMREHTVTPTWQAHSISYQSGKSCFSFESSIWLECWWQGWWGRSRFVGLKDTTQHIPFNGSQLADDNRKLAAKFQPFLINFRDNCDNLNGFSRNAILWVRQLFFQTLIIINEELQCCMKSKNRHTLPKHALPVVPSCATVLASTNGTEPALKFVFICRAETNSFYNSGTDWHIWVSRFQSALKIMKH